MIAYTGSDEHDAWLLWWWHHLVMTDEMQTTFTADLRPLGAFFAYWRTHPLFFRVGARYLWFVGWFEPVMDGAFAGLWVRADRRRTHAALEAVEAFLATGLARWPVLIGVTKQEKLLPAHVRLGYTVLGAVPGLWGGEPAWVVTLTQEGFDKRPARRTT